MADTSYLIDLMRGDPRAKEVAEQWEAEGWALHVPVVALHEIHRGLARSQLPLLEVERIRQVLAGLPALALDVESARLAGQLEGRLKEQGTPISPEDCMIAGIALRHGHAVLTRNLRDFRRVQGLDVVGY